MWKKYMYSPVKSVNAAVHNGAIKKNILQNKM